jgi:SAM-dependent methyltransferase
VQAVYRVLYRIGVTPWDGPGIPAPLMAEAGSPQPGVAVDLGCGTGHQARYLASRGWSVTAVDYLTEVIARARSRDLDGTVTWRAADVTDPAAVDPGGRLAGTATLVLDNGCLHGIAGRRRGGWARTVGALAAPGCVLLVRAVRRGPRGAGPLGIEPAELTRLLGDSWLPAPVPAPGWHRYVRGG